MSRVLILDQSKSMRKTLRERLEFEGFNVEEAAEINAAIELFESGLFDMILSDNHFEALPDTMRSTPFVVISSEASIDNALAAAKCGAVDFLTRPIDMNRLLKVLRETTEEPHDECAPTPNQSAVQRSAPRRRSCASSSHIEPMIGSSAAMNELNRLIERVAPTDARVLIIGENGTGKELVAKWLHYKSQRSRSPYVEINCAAIPSELIESELFGHEKGAFTSAVKQRKGKFEQANGGTLFLDEIGDMSLSAQAKVLRALQESKICRVGSDRDIDVDVRVIAATNKDIKEEIARGNFREDLYHRIGVIVMRVKPLRQRSEDIPQLVEHFLARVCTELSVERKEITPKALALLTDMPWSGNIRELRNVVERLVILSDDKIEADDVTCYCC
ncbi:MAG: sigma-54 dependent transcriptional regulator [Rikenellaceae bacterium]